mmetsp:Transcript_26357/g.51664  ORF Transcript_26357/g.51664 Transcript_26357/m.51664 type:complete len:347 (+) Transcript_26357:1000-2040(+)
MDLGFHARQQVNQEPRIRVRVWHIPPILVPFFDFGEWCHLTRINLPVVGLQVWTVEHILEHCPVLLNVGAGKIRHQMNVHLEATCLELLHGLDCSRSVMAPIYVLQHLIICMLDTYLHTCAAISPKPLQLRWCDMVWPCLQCKPDDLRDGNLIDLLLFQQREPLSSVSSCIAPLAQFALSFVKHVCCIEEVAAELLLVDARVVRPGAALHNEFHFVHCVPLLCQRACAVVELPDWIEFILVRPRHCGLRGQIRSRLPRLVRTVVAIIWTREIARSCNNGDYHNSRVGADRLLGGQFLEGEMALNTLGIQQPVVGTYYLRFRKCGLEPLSDLIDSTFILFLRSEIGA